MKEHRFKIKDTVHPDEGFVLKNTPMPFLKSPFGLINGCGMSTSVNSNPFFIIKNYLAHDYSNMDSKRRTDIKEELSHSSGNSREIRHAISEICVQSTTHRNQSQARPRLRGSSEKKESATLLGDNIRTKGRVRKEHSRAIFRSTKKLREIFTYFSRLKYEQHFGRLHGI